MFTADITNDEKIQLLNLLKMAVPSLNFDCVDKVTFESLTKVFNEVVQNLPHTRADAQPIAFGMLIGYTVSQNNKE